MRRFGAVAFVLVLAAIGAGSYLYLKKEPQAEFTSADAGARFAELEALAESAADGAPASEDDLRALADVLGGFASVDLGAIEEGPDGAVARGVVISFRDMDEAGFRIDELRAWGVNDGAAPGDPFADRIDARGIEMFGLETLVEKQVDAYMDVFESSVAEMAPEAELETAFETSIESYDLVADRIVVDGLAVHEAATADAAVNDENSFMTVMKMIADSNRLTSFDASAIYGLRINLKMEQPTGKTAVIMTAPVAVASNWRRGDIDYSAFRDFEYAFDMEVAVPETVDAVTGETQPAVGMPMQMSGGYDVFSVEDVRLARLYAYLADRAAPPVSETDLMSLGVWRVRGERQTFGDHVISSTEEAMFDLSKFHWLIPTDIRMTARGGRYNLSALFEYMEEAYLQGGGGDSPEEMEKVTAAFEKTGLDVISYDFDAAATWAHDTGAATSKMDIVADDLGDWRQSFEGTLPDFEGVKTMIPAAGEAVDWAAVTQTLMDMSALGKASVVLADKGGLDKGFAIAVEFANLAPEDDASGAMLRGADPADLRISSAAMMRLMGPQAAQNFPPAADYMTAVADFVQKGGVLRIEANPPGPVTMALFESEAEAMQTDPSRLADLLGLSVVHELAKSNDK